MTVLDQVYLMTADLERARRFYEDALGVTPSRVGGSSVAYETGGCELKIQADHDPEVLASFNMDPPPETGRGAGAVYVLEMSDPVDAVYDRVTGSVEDAGGRVLTSPRDVPWGGRMFLVESPDGYTFEIRGDDES